MDHKNKKDLLNIFNGKTENFSSGELTRRARIHTGTLCNYKCSFCYYRTDLTKYNSLEQIKKKIDYVKALGFTGIDFSGGECTIHPNWFEFLEYASNVGFETICVITNGIKFSDKDFLEKSIKKGINEILFSLHGYDEKTHESITNIKGSFKKIIKAINNSQDYRGIIKLKINSTVTSDTVGSFKSNFQVINGILPDELNIITVCQFDDNQELKFVGNTKFSYEELSNAYKHVIDNLNKKIKINVRFIPFCFMVGYEKHIVNWYQMNYDSTEWHFPVKELMDSGNFEKIDIKSHDIVDRYVKNVTIKSKIYEEKKDCFGCKYYFICEGLSKSIYIKPNKIIGKPIKDVNFYRIDYDKEFYGKV